MTSVNVTTTKNTVTVNGETRVVTVKTAGPQGPSLPDGDKGDVTVSSNGTAISINTGAVTSAKILDGTIVDADINASAAIALSKLATGALPTAITVTSANISDLSIVNADINASAAIALSKLATGTLPSGLKVNHNNLQTGIIENENISNSAAIQGTKINPNFGSQNITTTGQVFSSYATLTAVNPTLTFNDSDNNPDYTINVNSGILKITDSTNSADRLVVNTDGHVDVTGNLDVGAGVDITGDLTVSGNMTVSGTTTTIDTTTLTVEDKNIELGKVSTPTDTTADGGGITLKGATDKTFQWLDATDSWTSSEHIALPDNKKLKIGTGQDLAIFWDGSKGGIQTDVFRIKSLDNTENLLAINKDGGAFLYFDNVRKLDTTANGIDINSTGSGNGLIKINGASGSTEGIIIQRDGTEASRISHSNSADLIFSMGSSVATKLKLTSGGNLQIPADNAKLQIGASQDFQLYHDSTNSIIANSTGNTYIKGLGGSGNTIILEPKNNENSAKFIPDGAVELYFDHSKKAETTTNGFQVSNGNLDIFNTSGGASIRNISSSGSFFIGNPNNGDLALYVQDSTDNNIVLQVNTGEKMLECTAGGSTDLYHHGGLKLETTNLGVEITGTTNSTLSSGSGTLFLESTHNDVIVAASDDFFVRVQTSETGIHAKGNEAVELYFDNAKKFETTSEGGTLSGRLTISDTSPIINLTDTNNDSDFRIQVDAGTFIIEDATNSFVDRFLIDSNGNVQIPADNVKLQLGASQDLNLYHNSSNNSSFIDNTTGDLTIRGGGGNILINPVNNETAIYAIANAQVQLRYNNSTKLETTSTGIEVANTAADINIKSSTSSNSGGGQITFENVDGNGQPRDVVRIKGDTSGNGGYGELTLQTAFNNTLNDCLVIKKDGNVQIPTDNVKLQIGASQDLELYHDSSNSIINNTTGILRVRSDHLLLSKENNSRYLQGNAGVVELFFDNNKKFETHSTGSNITGSLGINTNTPASTIDARAVSGATITARNTGTAASIAMSVGSSTNQLVSRGVNSSTARDLLFMQGNTTAAKIDTSNNFLITNDNAKLQIGASQDLFLEHDGNNSVFRNATGDLYIQDNSAGNIYIQPVNNEGSINAFANDRVELAFDGSTKLQTTSTGGFLTGNFGIGNTSFTPSTSLHINNSGSSTQMRIENGNADFLIQAGDAGDDGLHFYDLDNSAYRMMIANSGNVGIGTITPTAKLDVAGNIAVSGGLTCGGAIFSGAVNIPDNYLFSLGSSNDLQLYHNGSNSYISNRGAGLLVIEATTGENGIVLAQNGSVDLYYDHSKKLETTSTGIDVNGSVTADDIITAGALLHEGDTDTLVHFSAADTIDLKTSGTERLRINNSGVSLFGVLYTNGRNISLGDSGSATDDRITFGESQDLQIYHNGNHSIINDTGTGFLVLGGSKSKIMNSNMDENCLTVTENGAVELYFDNSKKFQTTSTGNLFLGSIKGADNADLILGNSDDFQLVHTGTYSNIYNATGDLDISSNVTRLKNGNRSENFAAFINNGQAELYYDNVKRFETTSAGAKVTGELNVQSAGHTNFRVLSGDSSVIGFFQAVQGSDLRIGTSTNSAVNFAQNGLFRLTLDTNGNVNIPDDSGKLQLGASQDLQIYHDGSNSYISENGTGVLIVQGTQVVMRKADGSEDLAKFIENGAVQLYFDNSIKLETLSGGVRVHGDLRINDNENIYLGDGADLQISVGSNNDGVINQVDGDLKFQKSGAGKFTIKSTGTHFSDDAFWVDSQKAIFGTGNDLQIYHNGSHSFIDNSNGVGNLILYGNGTNSVVIQPVVGENSIVANSNSSVELFFDGSKKLETTSLGVAITGTTNSKLSAANGTLILESTNNDVLVESSDDFIVKVQTSETAINAIGNGAVELSFDSVKKLETTANGITVTGSVTTQDMNMSNLNGSANEVDNTKGSWSIQEGSDDLFIINRMTGKKYKFNLTEIS